MPQPDEPLAVLRDSAQQISVSLKELPWGRRRTDWGDTLSSGASVCSFVLIQLGCLSVLGTGFGGSGWWVLVDGRADGIREGHPLSSRCPSPLQCPLYLCPPLQAREEGGPPLTLGLEGEHQRSNAALALQLAHCWLQQKGYQGKWAGQWMGRGQVDQPVGALRGEDRVH